MSPHRVLVLPVPGGPCMSANTGPGSRHASTAASWSSFRVPGGTTARVPLRAVARARGCANCGLSTARCVAASSARTRCNATNSRAAVERLWFKTTMRISESFSDGTAPCLGLHTDARSARRRANRLLRGVRRVRTRTLATPCSSPCCGASISPRTCSTCLGIFCVGGPSSRACRPFRLPSSPIS